MPTNEPSVASLTLTLFGPMQVLVEGRPLPHLRSRKALWLLALLALRHDRPVEREWLAATLWPDVDQERAFANLRPVLSELRRALGSRMERLHSPTRNTLVLDLHGAEVDVVAFDAAIAGKKLSTLEQAVTLYRGPLLEGCNEEWAPQERRQREQDYLNALHKLADAALAAGNYPAAVGYFQRAVSIDPWGESARRGWMEALALGGDTNAALQVYREFVELLRSDPRAVPDEQMTALYMRLRAEARSRNTVRAAPPTPQAVVPTVKGALPHSLTDLVGREDERLEVAARLRRSRLMTLTGLGGIGKTRLALAVAAYVVKEYADGVWWVPLETLPDGKLLAQQIASVLGLREEPGHPILQSVVESLRNKRLLLVLDNCEHLLEASAQVIGRLLQECAEVRVLATSREALGVMGETVWAVPPLAVPDIRHLPSGRATLLRVLSGYESVQLFVARAQAVQQSFVLTGENVLTVARICSRLEGIPLALELAAARVRALDVEEMAARLHDHLGLLTGGSRTALLRQQTLRATMDWSYTLLSEQERVLLRRLAVFVGGWTLEAAENVCADFGSESFASESDGGPASDEIQNPESRIRNGQVLDLLSSLVDKSLVVFEVSETTGRHRLLEMVRQYAGEALQASGEIERIKARHRDWFVAFAEAAEPHLSEMEQERWLQRLETEHDNLRAALAWSLLQEQEQNLLQEQEQNGQKERNGQGESGQGSSALRLTGALWQFWYVRGYWREGREYLGRILAQERTPPRTTGWAKALNAAGALAYSQGDYAAARTLHEESLSLRRELEDRAGVAWSLNNLGNVAYDQGDYPTARALHEQSLSLRRELGDRSGMAWSLYSLGNVAHPQGEYTAARALYQESLSLFTGLGDRRGIARSLSCLGYVAFDQGDYALARTHYEESLSLFAELGDRGGIAWAHCCLGYLAYSQSDYGEAWASLERGLNLFKELGDRRGIAWSLNSLGNVAHDRGDAAAARVLHEQSLSLRRGLGDKQGIAWSLICLARAVHPQQEGYMARALYEESLSLFGELGDKKGVAENLAGLATLLLNQDRVAAAVRLWGTAHALRASIGAPLPPNEQAKYDRQVKQARFLLGEDAFGDAWEAGRIQSWEQAVQSALTD